MAVGEGENTTCHNNNNIEEARLHPAKVRVKFFESQQVTQVACTPPSPDVVLDFVSDSMASPISDQLAYARQMSAESGVDNPFRPDGELSREADTIVSLIKEGKPITPVKGESTDVPLDGSINGLPVDQTDSVPHEVKEEHISPTTANAVENAKIGANGSTPKDNSSAPGPGVVEVQHGVIAPPSDTPQVERVMIKKKPKCKCCVIQ